MEMVAETTVESGEPASKKPRLSDEDYKILRERLKSRKKLLIVSQIIFCIYKIKLEKYLINCSNAQSFDYVGWV